MRVGVAAHWPILSILGFSGSRVHVQNLTLLASSLAEKYVTVQIHTHTHNNTKTHKQTVLNNTSTPCLSACMDNYSQLTPTSFARCQLDAVFLISSTVHACSHGFVAFTLLSAVLFAEAASPTGPFICKIKKDILKPSQVICAIFLPTNLFKTLSNNNNATVG